MDNELEYMLNALKAAQPRWMAEGIGVRGNPVDMIKQQTQVSFPPPELIRSKGTDKSVTTSPGGVFKTIEPSTG